MPNEFLRVDAGSLHLVTPLSTKSAPFIREYLTDPLNARWLVLNKDFSDLGRVNEWIEEMGTNAWYFGIYEDSELVGHIGLKPTENPNEAEIGIVLTPESQNKKIGTNAVATILELSHRSGHQRLIARVNDANQASLKLFRQFNAKEERVKEDVIFTFSGTCFRPPGLEGVFEIEGAAYILTFLTTLASEKRDEYVLTMFTDPKSAIPEVVLKNDLDGFHDQHPLKTYGTKTKTYLPISHYWWERAICLEVIGKPIIFGDLSRETQTLAVRRWMTNPLTTRIEIEELADRSLDEIIREPTTARKENRFFNAVSESLNQLWKEHADKAVTVPFSQERLGFVDENYIFYYRRVFEKIDSKRSNYGTQLPKDTVQLMRQALGLDNRKAGMPIQQLHEVLPLFQRFLEQYMGGRTLLPDGYNFNQTDMKVNLRLLINRYIHMYYQMAEENVSSVNVHILKKLVENHEVHEVSDFKVEEEIWDRLEVEGAVVAINEGSKGDVYCIRLQIDGKTKVIFTPAGHARFLVAALVAARDFLLHPEEYNDFHIHEFLNNVPAGTRQRIKAQSISDILYITTEGALDYGNTLDGWIMHFRHEADHLKMMAEYVGFLSLHRSPAHSEGILYAMRHRPDLGLFIADKSGHYPPIFGPAQLTLEPWGEMTAARFSSSYLIWEFAGKELEKIGVTFTDLIQYLDDYSTKLRRTGNFSADWSWNFEKRVAAFGSEAIFYDGVARLIHDRIPIYNPEDALSLIGTGNLPLMMMVALMASPSRMHENRTVERVRELQGNLVAEKVQEGLNLFSGNPKVWYGCLHQALVKDFLSWYTPRVRRSMVQDYLEIRDNHSADAEIIGGLRDIETLLLTAPIEERVMMLMMPELYSLSTDDEWRLAYGYIFTKLAMEIPEVLALSRGREMMLKRLEQMITETDHKERKFAGRQLEVVKRTKEYIRRWIASERQLMEMTLPIRVEVLEPQRKIITPEDQSRMEEILRGTDVVSNFTCFPQLYAFSTHGENELIVLEFNGRKRILLLKEKPVKQVRILFSSQKGDEAFIRQIQKELSPKYIAYNLIPRQMEGLGEAAIRYDLISDARRVSGYEDRELRRKYHRAQRRNSGLYHKEAMLEDRHGIYTFFDQWDQMARSAGRQMATTMDRRLIDLYLGGNQVEGGLAIMGDMIVGVEFHAVHPLDRQLGVSIVLKNLREIDYRNLIDIGTYLQVEQARILRNMGCSRILMGGAEVERQRKFKMTFVGDIGTVNTFYSYEIFRDPSFVIQDENFLRDFW